MPTHRAPLGSLFSFFTFTIPSKLFCWLVALVLTHSSLFIYSLCTNALGCSLACLQQQFWEEEEVWISKRYVWYGSGMFRTHIWKLHPLAHEATWGCELRGRKSQPELPAAVAAERKFEDIRHNKIPFHSCQYDSGNSPSHSSSSICPIFSLPLKPIKMNKSVSMETTQWLRTLRLALNRIVNSKSYGRYKMLKKWDWKEPPLTSAHTHVHMHHYVVMYTEKDTLAHMVQVHSSVMNHTFPPNIRAIAEMGNCGCSMFTNKHTTAWQAHSA